jgi:hypothetical protein
MSNQIGTLSDAEIAIILAYRARSKPANKYLRIAVRSLLILAAILGAFLLQCTVQAMDYSDLHGMDTTAPAPAPLSWLIQILT